MVVVVAGSATMMVIRLVCVVGVLVMLMLVVVVAILVSTLTLVGPLAVVIAVV